MKKFIALLIAALLCISMLASASAETSLLFKGTNVDWINGTNLLRVQDKTGYGFADLTGKQLTGNLYDNSFYFEDGIITTSQLNTNSTNCEGALNLDGSVAIPFKYGDIKVLSPEWALGFTLVPATKDNFDYESWNSDDVYLIGSVDVYNLAAGACVGTLTRDQYTSAYAVGNCINIENRMTGVVTTYDAQFNALGTVKYTSSADFATLDRSTFRENGQYGIKDAAGNVILPPSFYSIYDYRYGYAEVSTGEKEGLVDYNGKVVLPAEFDEVKTGYYMPTSETYDTTGYNAFGYYCIVKNGKLGYATEGGVITCEPKYSKDIMENNGASATYTDMEGILHIMAADGVDTPITGVDRVRPANYAGGMFYVVTDSDYNYGLVDWHGNEIFPCQYDGIDFSGDGKYVMVNVDYEHCEIYEITYPVAAAPAAPAAEAPAAEAAPAAAGDPAAAKSLVESALVLLNTNAAANKDAAISLLSSANATAGTANPAVTALLDNAIALLTADAATNAPAVTSLLQSAVSLF